MILTEEQRKTFEEAAKPLIDWINKNGHPHMVAIVESNWAELSECTYGFPHPEDDDTVEGTH